MLNLFQMSQTNLFSDNGPHDEKNLYQEGASNIIDDLLKSWHAYT